MFDSPLAGAWGDFYTLPSLQIPGLRSLPGLQGWGLYNLWSGHLSGVILSGE